MDALLPEGSVEADGNVTFGYHTLNGAPEDVLMRLMCGTQSALELLGRMLIRPEGPVQ